MRRGTQRAGSRGRRVIVALILAAGGLTYAWGLGSNAAGIDFYQFWAGAQVARRAGSAIYESETRQSAAEEYLQRAYTREGSDRMLAAARARPKFEFFSTPFLYTCFGIFGGEEYDRDFLIYRVLCLAGTSAGVLLITRGVGLSPAVSLLLLAFLTTLFQPLRSDIRVGNVNQLQLLMAAGAIFLHSRSRFATGALLGLAAAFKPNVILAIPLVALRMDHGLEPVKDDRRSPVLDPSLIAGAFTGALAAVAVSGLSTFGR